MARTPDTAPLITVITPTHNRRSKVVRAVESVLAQNMTRFEHIVVDDGSTDGTAAALAEIRDPRLIYVGSKWRGANAARNAGIERARAPVVTFLDSDDVYLPDRLERTLERFDDNPVARSADQFLRVPEGQPPHQLRQPRGVPEPRLAGAGLGCADDLHCRLGNHRPARVACWPSAAMTATSRACRIANCCCALPGAAARNCPKMIDWKKYNSENSISGQRDGYVEAYANLIDKHPYIADRYPHIPPYMIARQLIADAIKGRVSQAFCRLSWPTARRRRSAIRAATVARLCRRPALAPRSLRRIPRQIWRTARPEASRKRQRFPSELSEPHRSSSGKYGSEKNRRSRSPCRQSIGAAASIGTTLGIGLNAAHFEDQLAAYGGGKFGGRIDRQHEGAGAAGHALA